MADILRSDVYKAYAALGHVPRNASRPFRRNGIYKAQLHELYCRVPDCVANFDNDVQLQQHLDTTHASHLGGEWHGSVRGTYTGKDLLNFYMDLMRYEDYPGKRDNGEQGGNECAGASPPQRPRRIARAPQFRVAHRPMPEFENDDDDDEELKMEPARTPEQAAQRQELEGVDGTSDHPTPPNEVDRREERPQLAAEVAMPGAYEDDELDLESKRRELAIKRRLLELELEEVLLERRQAALKKRKAEH